MNGDSHANESHPHEAVRQQFDAALTMLRRAIEDCPLALWERPSERMGYWFLAYHALFFVDHDLHPADIPFESPWFDRHEYHVRFVEPPFEDPYSQADLLAYLDQCWTRAAEVLETLGRGESLDSLGTRRLEISPLEVVLYELRHVQHHTAQLNTLLRAEGVEPHAWVRRGDPSDPEQDGRRRSP